MLNIEFFNKLEEINKLFSNLHYNKSICNLNIGNLNIGNLNKNLENIYLIFKNKNNVEEKYLVIIHNDIDIDVTIPIKNSNYKYSTKLKNIYDVYNYLYLHIVNYNR
tara:strand:- start:740 stop:1060 length:321 start_codon:yes stop_codon:yes gene_type:complete